MGRILVLDDEPARHALFAAAWREHDIIQAWTAQEGVTALLEAKFDVVTLDHDLGPASRGDGTRVAHQLADMLDEQRPSQVFVHSANPVGAKAMLDILRSAGINAQRIDPLRL